MKVIVTGATGFVGRALVDALQEQGDQVVGLTRDVRKARQRLGANVEAREWSPPEPGLWMEAFDGADGIVNLAGEPVAASHVTGVLTKRWTRARKARILSSRVDATRAVVDGIERADPRPRVLVNQSAIGYYGPRGDTVLTEDSPAGDNFEAGVVKAWEAAARPVEESGVRLVRLRSGHVLGRNGGLLPLMANPFRFFVGGTMGRRDQWVSWIHLDDEIGLILYALTHDAVHGPVNATAPHPVTMETFCRQIGQAIGRPCWVPLLDKALKIGLGEQSRAMLASIRVVPQAAQAAGYRFQHPHSVEALRSLL